MSLVAGFHNSSSMTVTVIFIVNYSDFVLINYVFHLCWQCLVEEVSHSYDLEKVGILLEKRTESN